jgi:membrane associated rhomboid family serine protease
VLILPLHRPLTAATFPYATALLILLNVLVFFGWQSGDEQARDTAAHYYLDAGLADLEAPAYARWRKEHPRAPEVELPRAHGMPPEIVTLARIQQDLAFLADLRAGKVITPQDADYARWLPLRTEFDRLWGRSFTDRHSMRFSELDVGRMFSAMFLHGDTGHLVGNMVFLAFVGMLVEGALGSRQFLLLYLLGGLGAQFASQAWRWGDGGTGLGASGAIAALMGAFAVLWGKRKVRFFWWFFVVFDYVRAPALWLLPFWLGWEVLNLLFNDGAGVGFDAHAGGLLSGAALAFVAVRLGRERREFLDADAAEDAAADDPLPRALGHLAKLEIAEAKRLLAPTAAAGDAPMAVRVAWYRCCRYDAAGSDVHDAALRVLQARATHLEHGERMRVFDDYLQAHAGRAGFAAAAGVAVARQWLEAGAPDDVEKLLPALDDPTGAAGTADAWVALARSWQGRRDGVRARAACAEVLRRYPGTPAAAKAAFLQSADAT